MSFVHNASYITAFDSSNCIPTTNPKISEISSAYSDWAKPRKHSLNRADTSTWDVPVYPRNQTTGHYIHALLHGLFHRLFLNSLSTQSLTPSTGVLPHAYAILHHAGGSPLSSASARTSEITTYRDSENWATMSTDDWFTNSQECRRHVASHDGRMVNTNVCGVLELSSVNKL